MPLKAKLREATAAARAPGIGPAKAELRPEMRFAPDGGPAKAELGPEMRFAPGIGPAKAELRPEMSEFFVG